MPAKKTKAEPNRTKDIQLGVRMKAEDKAALHALAEHYGISMGDTVTMLVRKAARSEAVTVRPLEHYTP